MTVLRLDVAASFARTALTDPHGLPEEEHRRVTSDAVPPLPAASGLHIAYAVDRLDEIIEALNPSYEITRNFARGLAVLGGHLAELQDTMRACSGVDPEPYASMYAGVVAELDAALDRVDAAVAALDEIRETPDSLAG